MSNFEIIKTRLLAFDDELDDFNHWLKTIEVYYERCGQNSNPQEEVPIFATLLTTKFLNLITVYENAYALNNESTDPDCIKVRIFEHLFYHFKVELDPTYHSIDFIKARQNTQAISSMLMTSLQSVWDSITVKKYLRYTCARTDLGPINRDDKDKLKEIKLANSIINCFFPDIDSGPRPVVGIDSPTLPQAQIGEDCHNVVFNQWLIEKSKGMHLKNKLLKANAKIMSKLDEKCSITMNAPTKSGKHNFFLALAGVILYSVLNIPTPGHNRKIANEVLAHFGLTPGAPITPFFNMMMFERLARCTENHKNLIVEQMQKSSQKHLINFLIKNSYTLNKDLEILQEKILLEKTVGFARPVVNLKSSKI